MSSNVQLHEFQLAFGDRLRAERKRMGLSQAEMAELAGVQRRAQISYESGERSPQAEYLHRLGLAGVNVAYVLTGEMPLQILGDVETAVVARFQAVSADTQRAVLGVLGLSPAALNADAGEVAAGTRGSVSIAGDMQGQVLSGEIRQDHLTFNVGSRSSRRAKSSK